ncbi:MAG: hypothetical protein JNL71_01115 [Rhodospirillales bacterium]|nr:hypothetical protein [Rhodospirillales bacterium]
MRAPAILLACLIAGSVVAQTTPEGQVCKSDGFGRDISTKMTDTLLDMGFVGFERMTVVDGCYRVVARNPAGDLVVLTFDTMGELIGLGLGSGGAAPRFAPPRDGIRATD